MSRKLMVLGLAAVLVVAVAIPVVAQERAVTPKLQAISKRALKKSATALRVSRDAGWRAGTARLEAQAAAETANRAAAAAAGAQADVDATRIRTATASDSVATESEDFVGLTAGPSVQVTVPASGLIEVWAQATIDGDGAVSLFEDGKPLAGQSELCSPDEEVGVLFSVPNAGEPLTVATPAAAGPPCGTIGAPGPVLFQTSPGTHTYELRYASCGCGDASEPVTFSDRRLFVGPRL